MHVPDTIGEEGLRAPGRRTCPAWFEAISPAALRLSAVGLCVAVWSGAIYGVAALIG